MLYIRKLKSGEKSAFVEMALASWLDAYDGLFPAAIIEGARAMIEKAANERFDEFRVAAEGDAKGDRLLGYYSLGEEGYLWHLYVDPARYRGGVGSQLLEAAEDEIRQRGMVKADLDVHKENKRAIGFYKARGFVVTGEEDTEFGLHLLMEKPLSPIG